MWVRAGCRLNRLELRVGEREKVEGSVGIKEDEATEEERRKLSKQGSPRNSTKNRKVILILLIFV